MTEDEAAKKQCCGPDGCGYFNELPHPARYCIASACMAWRWESDFNDLVDRFPEKSTAELKQIADGYCGLAGKP